VIAQHPRRRRLGPAACLHLCLTALAGPSLAQAPPDTVALPLVRADLGVVKTARSANPEE